jgi:hypothetical protein
MVIILLMSLYNFNLLISCVCKNNTINDIKSCVATFQNDIYTKSVDDITLYTCHKLTVK